MLIYWTSDLASPLLLSPATPAVWAASHPT